MIRATSVTPDNGGKSVGTRIAVIGTSLVQQNHGGGSNYTKTFARGWLPWAHAYSKGAFYCPVWYDPTVIVGWEPSGVAGTTRYFQGLNFGVSGQMISEIEARLPYIIQNYINKFDIIIVDAGTNDMSAQTASYIQTKRENICNTFTRYGKKVILLPILSRSTSEWPSGGNERKRANWINSKSREYAKRTNGVYIFDWNKYWTDMSTADGTPYAARTGDGTHFDNEGGEYVGEGLANFLAGLLPPAPISAWSADNVYDATINTRGSFLPINPFLLGATAGTNGTGSAGTVISNGRVERSSGTLCTVVNSIEARPDGRGNNQVMTFTLAGATDETFYFRTATANTTHAKAGKYIVGRCEVETNASDQIYGVSLVVEDQYGVKMQVQALDDYTYTAKGTLSKWATKARNILLETPPLLLDALSTDVRWRVEIIVRGGGSVAPVVKVGCVEMCEVDDPKVW